MTDQSSNPYANPTAHVVDMLPDEHELASLGLRFGGMLIDAAIGVAFLLPLLFAIGYLDWQDMVAGVRPDMAARIKNGVVGFIVFLMVQGYFLHATSQTIGKKILGMRIVTLENQKPEFFKLIFLRYMVVRAIYVVPVVGTIFSIANSISIFIGKDRRCIHDRFAGTKVIVAK